MVERDSSIELSRDELCALLEQEAQRRRGTSARALLRAYAERRLEDPGDVADLLALAGLLPDNDPLLIAS